MDTSDEWIRERSGVETRYYVDPGTATSDLGVAAAAQALEHARRGHGRGRPRHLRHHDPRPLLPRLRAPCCRPSSACATCPASTSASSASASSTACSSRTPTSAPGSRGPCSWWEPRSTAASCPTRAANWEYLYGRARRAAHARGVRLEHALPPPDRALRRRGGGGGPAGARTASAGVLDPILHTDGADYDKLYVPGTGFKHRPYTDPEQFARGDHIPVMDGRYVFKMATTRMVEVAQEILARNGVARGRPVARAHAPGQQAHQRVLPEGAGAPRREGPPQHPAATGTPPPPPSRCCGTRPRGRPAPARATWC